jgi:hypothetical protein
MTYFVMRPVLLAFIMLGTWLFALNSTAQVYRCGNNYSIAPCTGGRAVETAPAVGSTSSESGSSTVYLCKTYGGGTFWSRAHCNTQNALVERIESVPAGLSWDHQVEMARDQRDRERVLTSPPAAQVQQGPATATRVTQCASLEARINRLDQLARNGGTASYMDWVAGEKRLARDQHFRQRC